MDWVGLANAAQNVAFPIIVCIYLFFQNDKLRGTVDDLKDVIRDNTTSINELKTALHLVFEFKEDKKE